MKKKYLISIIMFVIVISTINLYHKYQQFKIGSDAVYSGSAVVAIAMLEPLANDGFITPQILLASIYAQNSETVPRDYAKALYWCVRANKPFLAGILGYDIEAINKACEINFAKEALDVSLQHLNDEYNKNKFISGINWLKIAYLRGDKSTHNLFEECNIKTVYVYMPTNKWDITKFQCICKNFDWGERNRPDCTIGEQINKIESI